MLDFPFPADVPGFFPFIWFVVNFFSSLPLLVFVGYAVYCYIGQDVYDKEMALENARYIQIGLFLFNVFMLFGFFFTSWELLFWHFATVLFGHFVFAFLWAIFAATIIVAIIAIVAVFEVAIPVVIAIFAVALTPIAMGLSFFDAARNCDKCLKSLSE